MNKEKIEIKKYPNSDGRQIDLIILLSYLWQERKKIFIITLMCSVIGLFYAIFATPWYEATVKILPSNESRSGLSQYSGIASMFGINLGTFNENKQELYPEIIKSNFVLDRVLEHKFIVQSFRKPVTLFEFWNEIIDSNKVGSKRILYDNKKRILRNEYIFCRIDKTTNILILTVTVPKDPLLAANLANFIVDQLDYYNRNLRKYKARDQRRFIEKGAEDADKKLKISQEYLKNFREVNRNIKFSPEKQLELERLQTELEVQKAIYIELKKQFEITKIEEIKETETLDILEAAELPVNRKKPHRSIILIAVTLSGFFFSIFIIILYHLLKDKAYLKFIHN